MTAGGDVDLRPIGPSEVEDLLADLVDLYAACYSAPPWNETEADFGAYASRVRTWAQADGFCGLAGLAARRGAVELVGATYGWRGPAEIGGEPLPGVDADEVFHVGDLMVHPASQGQGLGRRLLGRLVAGHAPAVLVTHPEAPARRLYERTGWRHTGELGPPGSPTWLVYLRP